MFEETGIRTKFQSILGFRESHGLTHGRSDLFFVCRLDPIVGAGTTTNNNATTTGDSIIIPEPIPEPDEIETAAWIPMNEFRTMVFHYEGQGHPMMQLIMNVFDQGQTRIDQTIVDSVVPGREPNAVYVPVVATTRPTTITTITTEEAI